MAPWIVLACTLCLSVAAAVTTENGSSCDDIDTSACKLMASRKQNFCDDPLLSATACPRYCKLCPVECYHCNTTVTDFHMCNTTRLCAKGEVCMRKQLKSFADSHFEYEMTCESTQILIPYDAKTSVHTCDGSGLVIPFGKRNVESRDVSVSCCDTDRCNYPAEVTTKPATFAPSTQISTTTLANGCKKDLIVIVDESRSLVKYTDDIVNLLTKLTGLIPVGQNNVLMSLATFADTAQSRWDLNDHTTRYQLMGALSGLDLHGGNGDLNAAIKFAIAQVNGGSNGNRKDAPDAVLIITDDPGRQTSTEILLDRQLHTYTDNVIVIGIGTHLTTSELAYLASDNTHAFHVHSATSVDQLYSNVANLICPGVSVVHWG